MINFEALFSISYGLYIVSSGKYKKGSGFISNTVFQVTAEPANIAISCNKDKYTAQLIEESKAFSVSVLKQDTSIQLIGTFGYKSGKSTDKLKGINVVEGKTGVPIVLNDTIAFVECKLIKTFDVGSHKLYIGELVQSERLSEEPALTYSYYREVKKGIAPKNAPTYIDKSKLQNAQKEVTGLKKFKCAACGYIYDPDKGDPESGVSAGTSFDDLPSGWACPVCGADKDDFYEH